MSLVENKPTIMILGSFHMGPTNDMYQTEVDHLLSSKRQGEIQEVVNRLKKFNPTKVAVEMVADKDDQLNELYVQYVSGKGELEVNEIDQIGFRVASQCNHSKLYAIDWMERGVGKRGYVDVYEWAKQNEPDLFAQVFKDLHPPEIDPAKTILELYHDCNKPEFYEKAHQMYVNIARIGTDNHYVGLDWLMWWYQRNLIQFANLTKMATSPEDRILLIIGASHVKILEQFILDSDFFHVVRPEQYLY